MYTIRKKFKFEMAHQLNDAWSEDCSNSLHGHSYILELFFSSNELDSTGMVEDFGKIKHVLGEYINSWDHCIVIPDTFNKEYIKILKKYNKKIKVVHYNPTAENMCKQIFSYINIIYPQLSKVRLHETTTGWSEYSV